MRATVFLIVVIVACVVPLVFGIEAVLLFELGGRLPLGTLLAALSLSAAAAIPVVISRPGSIVRRAAIFAFAASVLWLPIGAWLSGNAALNFSNDAGDSLVFWRYTGALVVLIVALLIVAPLLSRLRRRSD